MRGYSLIKNIHLGAVNVAITICCSFYRQRQDWKLLASYPELNNTARGWSAGELFHGGCGETRTARQLVTVHLLRPI
ncbi:hypothetical protein GJAV_G00095450 [Gymnothorax javanicus]|nr:hypothetical protein GJAV_G00095450 [Gymnothorax javanicus]